jgi:hypothetical protein
MRNVQPEENLRKGTSLEEEFQNLKIEPEEGRYELLKRKIIKHLVRNKIYDKESAEDLKRQIEEKFNFLNQGMVEEVFHEIFQYFFK